MPEARWMIYGATGYTGQLIVEEAVRRGHRPMVAGRSEQKLARLAERFNLERAVVSLDEESALAQAVAGVKLVLHAAGPFTDTSRPMLQACLATGANYVDITGELSVLEHTLTHDQAARQKNIVLISGAGFDAIPTDCLARYVADQISGAAELETGIATASRPTAGTAISVLEMLPQGVLVRRAGDLVSQPWGSGVRQIRFSHGERTALPIPWGDLVAAYRTTGIPNITSYVAYPAGDIQLMHLVAPLGQRLLAIKPIRRLVQSLAGKLAKGPNEEMRQSGRSYLWARAADPEGREAQAWLETVETYRFTAMAAVRCVEKILEQRPHGALTPALALGADFVLDIEGTQRFDRLPDRG